MCSLFFNLNKGYAMDKYYLYTEMLEYKREVVNQEELLQKERQNTVRKFKTDEELKAYLDEKPLKVDEGWYTANNKVLHGRQGYASVLYYNKEDLDKHLATTNSISGYTGRCSTDWLYFDLESKISIEHLTKSVNTFLTFLQDNKVDFIAFFSGNKGLHLYVPINVYSFPEQYKDKGNLIAKAFAYQMGKLFPEFNEIIDPQIYAINTVLRMPFTINPKSGLLKTVMTFKDNKFIRMKNDLTVFQSIYEVLLKGKHSEREPIWTMDESLVNTAEPTEIKFDTYFPCPYGEKACIYKLLNAKLKEGEHRHEAAMRLMSWLKNDKEFPNEFVWAFLQTWNKSIADPMHEKELKNIYRYIETVNYNLCKDQFMDPFCIKNGQCQYWSTKVSGLKAVSMLSALKAYTADEADMLLRFNLDRIFEGMNVEIKPSRGAILAVIAGSKVGKTLISLTIALRAKIPTVVFSYEISKIGVLQTLGKMLGLDPLDKMDQKRFLEETRHIFIVDEGRTPLQQIPTEVKRIEQTFKVKVSIVILDYLQLVPVFDINKTGRYVTNVTERMDIISGQLPELVKQHQWLCVVPTQPTKGVEGGGRAILLPDAGKGGQAIQAMVDYTITAWRPFKNDDPMNVTNTDDVISLWMCSNRWGQEDVIRNYNYYGNKRLISGTYSKPVCHTPAVTQKD